MNRQSQTLVNGSVFHSHQLQLQQALESGIEFEVVEPRGGLKRRTTGRRSKEQRRREGLLRGWRCRIPSLAEQLLEDRGLTALDLAHDTPEGHASSSNLPEYPLDREWRTAGCAGEKSNCVFIHRPNRRPQGQPLDGMLDEGSGVRGAEAVDGDDVALVGQSEARGDQHAAPGWQLAEELQDVARGRRLHIQVVEQDQDVDAFQRSPQLSEAFLSRKCG